MNYFRCTIFLLSTIFIFQSCTKTSPIKLNNEKQLYSEEMGSGVYLTPPPSFNRAKTYSGFQAPHKMGSISLAIEDDFDSWKHYHSSESISARDGKLYRLQPIEYGDNTRAFYVEYYDSPQKRYRQELLIEKYNKVYHIKGFYRGNPDMPETDIIRKAILTTYIDAYKEEEKPFSKVFLADLENFHYTRDNKYPTEEPDSLVIKVSVIDLVNEGISDYKKFLSETVTDITNMDADVKSKKLVNGYLYKCTSANPVKRVLFMLITNDVNNEANLIQCIGNEKTDLKDVSMHIHSKFISLVD